MTRVLQKPMALLAACLLAIGCAIVIAMPQQADARDLKITAGTLFNTATNLPLTDSTLTSTNKTAFNEACDNSFYKFTTSARRDSRYKLTIKSYAGQLIYATIYNSTHHRIANVKVGSESASGKSATRSWIFRNLTPKSTYYVELWRFMVDTSGFVQTGVVNGEYNEERGQSTYVYVPYKIRVKEVVKKPSMSTVKVWSVYNSKAKNHKHFLKLKWGDPSFNTDGVQIRFWWFDMSGKKHVFYRTAPTKNSYSTWTMHWGDKYPYHVTARPYVKVSNSKHIFGKWANVKVRMYNKCASLDKTTGKYTGKYQWVFSNSKLVKSKKVTTKAGARWTYKWVTTKNTNKRIADLVIQ